MSLLLFERFGIEGAFVQDSAVLSLYAMGRLTGSVVDCGHTKIDIAPVYEGLLRTQGIRRLPFGGMNLTNALHESLGIDLEASEMLKEQCSTVCELQDAFESIADETKSFTLPDGQSFAIKEKQCAWMGELLFRPEMMNVSSPGIAESLYNATYCQVTSLQQVSHIFRSSRIFNPKDNIWNTFCCVEEPV